MNLNVDFIVVGSGIAGLNAALTLNSFGKVLLITKKRNVDATTNYAQGGIAAVTEKKDSVLLHEQDTLRAGAFHNKKESVRFLVKHGKNAIDKLVSVGVPFERKDGSFATTLEAAHSYPRILHAKDFTGQAIEHALIAAVRNAKNIEIWEHTYATDLLVKNNSCFGIQVIKNEQIISLFSRSVVLATGGVGQLYLWTTNPDVATGDGIAMAKRAGAKLSDMEFVQFHPTALKQNTSPLFLLSEALRGEGAFLLDKKGKRFMQKLHTDAELAPRDVVARAIFKKQKEGGVYLDIRSKGKAFLTKRFPNLYKNVMKKGYDLAKDVVPVTPAAHFLCGGITTDLYGRTSIRNLLAYGETAATGVHGANRLASNSLLEGMVFSSQIAKCVNKMPKMPRVIPVPNQIYSKKISPNALKKQIREIMWQYVGIERSKKELHYAIKELKTLEKTLEKIIQKGINEALLEIANMLQTALLIANAAYKRKTSLGAHYLTS